LVAAAARDGGGAPTALRDLPFVQHPRPCPRSPPSPALRQRLGENLARRGEMAGRARDPRPFLPARTMMREARGVAPLPPVLRDGGIVAAANGNGTLLCAAPLSLLPCLLELLYPGGAPIDLAFVKETRRRRARIRRGLVGVVVWTPPSPSLSLAVAGGV
jgi:hypothetical protein